MRTSYILVHILIDLISQEINQTSQTNLFGEMKGVDLKNTLSKLKSAYSQLKNHATINGVDAESLPEYKTLKVLIDDYLQNLSISDDPVFEAFLRFHASYPKDGRKRGIETEFKDFRKHEDYRIVSLQLVAKIEMLISYREGCKTKGTWIPAMPNMKTWLHQRRWEEIDDIPLMDNKDSGSGDEYGKL